MVPVRADHKKIAPDGLDYSAGGHVGAGETYEVGLLREIKEELGLMLNESDLRYLASFTPLGGDNWFRKVFVYRTNKAPKYNTDDFKSYEWMTPVELHLALKNGVPAKTSLLETVDFIVKNDLI